MSLNGRNCIRKQQFAQRPKQLSERQELFSPYIADGSALGLAVAQICNSAREGTGHNHNRIRQLFGEAREAIANVTAENPSEKPRARGS